MNKFLILKQSMDLIHNFVNKTIAMPYYSKKKFLLTIIHIIGWGIMFGFPFFFSTKNDPITLNWYLGFCFVPIAFMIVFYSNFFLLIDRTLFRKKIILFILLNMLLIAVTVWGVHLWHQFYITHFSTRPPREGHFPPVIMILVRDYILMALTAGLAVAIKTTGKWYKIEAEKKELEKAHTEAELQNLKSQLNPHFLFNTLNNIYSLIAINPDRAQFAVHALSQLLRHVLYENNENTVPLVKELAFMKSYIELMSLRLAHNVKLDVSIPESTEGINIAPLLFIALIENAFKHGTSPTEESFIRIYITLKGKDEITCTIQNSYFPKKDNDRSGSGIGISNLRKRLQLLYPSRHILKAGKDGNTYNTTLTISL